MAYSPPDLGGRVLVFHPGFILLCPAAPVALAPPNAQCSPQPGSDSMGHCHSTLSGSSGSRRLAGPIPALLA